MPKDWKKEMARDALALGSIVFYSLVIARSMIDPFLPYLYQLVISGAILFVILQFVKDYDGYLARAMILGLFTSMFYGDVPFGVFALIVYLGMIVASFSLGSSTRAMTSGIVSGAVSAGCGYYFATFLL